MKKAQSVSTELMFAVAIIIIMFTVLFSFMLEKKADTTEGGEKLDRRAECLRISNLLSSVSAGGTGTEATTKLDKVVAIFNNSVIYVAESGNLSLSKYNVAIVASEAGNTSQDFYDLANESLMPDWYKACFSNIGSTADCDSGSGVVDWSLIPYTFSDLIKNISDNPGSYATIYLDDANILYNASYNGKNYTAILSDWVKQGGRLILSEHVMCREQDSVTYSTTDYRCNRSWTSNDVWSIFNVSLTQQDNAEWVKVIVEPDHTIFNSDLQINKRIQFAQNPYVESVQSLVPGNNETADGGSLQNNVTDAARNFGSYLNTSSEDCLIEGAIRTCGTVSGKSYAWEVGHSGLSNWLPFHFNVTFVFNVSHLGIIGSDITSLILNWSGCWNGGADQGTVSSYEHRCGNDNKPEFRDDTNGYFEVLIFNGTGYERLNCSSKCETNGILLLGNHKDDASWGNANDYNYFSYTKTSSFNDNYIQNGNISIRFRTWGMNDNGERHEIWQEIDYVYLTIDYAGEGPGSALDINTIAEYENSGKPAIAYWSYGNGKVFYFPAFNRIDGDLTEDQWQGVIVDLTEHAKFNVDSLNKESSCNFIGRSPDYVFDSGSTIRVKNVDNEIVIQNVK